MKINFLKKKISTKFVKNDFARNASADWVRVLFIFSIAFTLIFSASMYLLYLVNSEDLYNSSAGPTILPVKLEAEKLEKISKIISDRKAEEARIIDTKPTVLDPSL